MSARRRILDAARRRFPAAYQRARDAAALPRGVAAWYAHRLRGGEDEGEAYDAGFWDYHAGGDWDGFARVLLRHAPARSVLDVGCGDGKLLAAIARVQTDARVLGIDGSPTALRVAEGRGVTTREMDLASVGRRRIEAVAREIGAFDLSVSLETVEHFPPWHSGKLLRLVACAPVVAFSAAQPGQGGTLHVNERPVAHWVRRFRRLGYELSPRNDAFRGEVRALDLPPWYGANVNLFVRRP
ncbi:MAG TPA: class I SAM-dependent methyltransferase [Longimicrobium sp.]|nr:class I SAM-dependent methyltransferase [Longimicrobium sp.]